MDAAATYSVGWIGLGGARRDHIESPLASPASMAGDCGDNALIWRAHLSRGAPPPTYEDSLVAVMPTLRLSFAPHLGINY
jgi:hypothetical protein